MEGKKARVQTPKFGRIKRQPSKLRGSTDSAASDEVSRAARTAVADLEAYNSIKEQCGVALEVLEGDGDPGTYKITEVSDIMSGLNILANLNRRIVTLKERAQINFSELLCEAEAAQGQYRSKIAKIQEGNKKIQEDLQIAVDTCKFAERRAEQIKETAAEDVKRLEQQLQDEKASHNSLKEQVKKLEEQVMMIPKMEEAHIRAIEILQRHHGDELRENQARKMTFTQKSDEMRFYIFWKDKVPLLEGTAVKQAREIRKLRAEVKLYSNKYFTLLNGNGKGKERSKSASVSGKNVSTPSSPSKERKTTIAWGETTIETTKTVTTNSDKVNDSLLHLNGADRTKQLAQGYTLTKRDKEELHETCKVLGKSLEQHCLEEIVRLNRAIRKRDGLIGKLSSTLSFSQAYPLLAVANPTNVANTDRQPADDGDLSSAPAKAKERPSMETRAKQHTVSPSVEVEKFFKDLGHIPDAGEYLDISEEAVRAFMGDLESQSPKFAEEEQACTQAREEKAKKLQVEFNNQMAQNRRHRNNSKSPAHIRAIRTSKSFSYGSK